MLLAVDIGNTSIHNGIFRGKALKRTFRIPTHARGLAQQYAGRLRPCLKEIQGVIVVSVVPGVLRQVEKILKKMLGRRVLVVGRDVDSGVKNLYKKPRQVGQDRLVNARAAYETCSSGAVVVDFGTAITIDIVTKNKEYLGGVIAPGVEISLNALAEKAYLLPKVGIRRPAGVLGRETRQSIVSGAVYGFSSLCDGLVQRLKKRHCSRAKVIATGGLSPIIGPYCETVDKIDPELTLKGLRLIGSEHNV